MRKHIRLLALALVPLMVVACNNTKTTSEISSSDSSIISSLEESTTTSSSTSSEVSTSTSTSSVTSTSSSSSSSSSTSSISSISSSSEIPTSSSSSSSSSTPSYDPNVVYNVEIGDFYSTHVWDATIKDMIQRALGDSWEKFPDFVAPSYEASLAIDQTTGKDILVFEVACYGVNPSSCERLYKEKMQSYGYILSSLGEYGYQMEDYTTDIFLSYELHKEEQTPYFLLSAFKKVCRQKDWSTDFVNLYADMEIPACEAPCYDSLYDNTRDTLSVYALFIDRTSALNAYVNKLCKSGLTVSGTDQYGTTTLVDESGYLTVQLSLTYGDYDCDALLIKFVNAWPTIPIASFIGAQNFPKLDSYTATYDGYGYVDSVGQGKDEDYTLCIYYKNASSTDYGAYINQLVAIGMQKGEMVNYSDNVTYSINMTYTTAELSIRVQVLYRSSVNIICIAIYQATTIK